MQSVIEKVIEPIFNAYLVLNVGTKIKAIEEEEEEDEVEANDKAAGGNGWNNKKLQNKLLIQNIFLTLILINKLPKQTKMKPKLTQSK